MQETQIVPSESSEMIDKQRREASINFGKIIHRAAVQAKSKTKLGLEAGFAEEDAKPLVKSITDGNAHLHDQAILDGLISAAVGKVHPTDLARLRQSAKIIRRES
jgi:hypothetical protein